MSLLSLKAKLNKSVFLLLTFLSTGLSANDSIPKFNFAEHCKKSDAYLVHSYTDITYAKSFSGYRKYISISNKLVVNNSDGVDQFAFLSLERHVANNIYEIDVKTLKSNGSVIELDSSDVFQHKTKNIKSEIINHPIPGVEPGDTILIKYTYTEYPKSHQMMDFVNLYANVPSLNSEYSIRTTPTLNIRYKRYNGFPEPQVIANDTLTYCVFKMEEVQGLKENEYTCIPCELPYMYYSMEKSDAKRRTWKDVYNQEFNVITQPIALDSENSAFYNRWKKSTLGSAKDSSKYYQLKLLHKDILENMQMEDPKESEILKSSGYFLKEKRFNHLSIRRLYRRLLEDLEIEYWAVFGRSKQAGKIDPYYIRKGEFDHVFFAYKDDKGSLNLLYPHDTYSKYQINEIPTSVYNTKAVITKPYFQKKLRRKDKFISRDLELAEVDSVSVQMINLPETSADHNYAKQVYYSKIEPNATDQVPTKYRIAVSGGVYTDLKGFFGLLAQEEEVSEFYDALDEFEGNEDVMQIDTITSTHFKETPPFGYIMIAEGRLKDAISSLNNNMISISLDNLVEHNQVASDEEVSDLNYYLDYQYTDDIMLILKFPDDIEVLNADSYNTHFENELGAYSFDLKIVDGNEVTIQSNYKITKGVIPKDKYGNLKELNQLVKTMQNKRILVKIKNL